MRAVIFAVAAVMFLPVAAIAQISPGRLAQPHQSLEGPTNCARCHGASPSEMPKRCLACHREVAWLIARNRGVHARGADMANRSCGSCHPDHAGSAFEMVAWDAGGKNAFDHRKSGWQLAGKHRTIRCEECHQNQYRVSAGAALSPRKSSPGWMGLETDCASCHRRDDPHQNALGPNCQECHDAAGWAPAPAFDHAKSRYPLTGLHQDVACAQCHQSSPSDPVDASGQRIPRFRPLAHTECSNCHRDPHRGALSARCTSCHVTGGFDVIEKGAFDHSATRYPLQGKHRSARCDDCHGTAMARPRPTFAACANCHADAHAGEGTLAGAAADCAVCHRVEGFRPSTFTVARHAGTQFALAGKHLSVACGDCHTRAVPLGGKVTVTRLRLTSRTCADCHATPHGSQLPGTSCESCHGDAGWATMLYERALHAATALPLDGAHAAASCMSCHGTNRPGLPAIRAEAGAGSAEVVFRLSERTCTECHADPHRADSAGKAPVDCAACHTTRAFRESTVNVVDHARFKFGTCQQF